MKDSNQVRSEWGGFRDWCLQKINMSSLVLEIQYLLYTSKIYVASHQSWCFVMFSLASSGYQWGCPIAAVSAPRTCQKCFTKYLDWRDATRWRQLNNEQSRNTETPLLGSPVARGLPGHRAPVRLHERHLPRRGRPRRGHQRRRGQSRGSLHVRRRPQCLHFYQGLVMLPKFIKFYHDPCTYKGDPGGYCRDYRVTRHLDSYILLQSIWGRYQRSWPRPTAENWSKERRSRFAPKSLEDTEVIQ